MNKTENYHYISDLLLKEATGTLTDAERQELSAWKADDAHREQLSEWMRDYGFLQEEYRAWKSVDVEKAVHEMEQRIQGDSHEEPSAKKSPQISYLRIFRYAAAVLILVVAGAALWYSQYTKVTPPEISEEVQTAMMLSEKSGRNEAEIISVNNRATKALTSEEQTYYHVDADFVEQLVEAKRVTTYHNKEYWVTLDDGTAVHLDNNSRFIYPEKFGDSREVILEGTAYFMVAHDKSRRFVVHTPQGDVKVYGTEFFVTNHPIAEKEHATLQVVLVKGSVGVTPLDGRETMIKPGQQLCIRGNGVEVEDVDLTPFISWNTGTFSFRYEPLEHVTDVLAQWYDVEFSFADKEISEKPVVGDFDRYEQFENILNALSKTMGLSFDQQGRKITISKK